MPAAQDHPVFAGRGNALGPAEQVSGGRFESPLRMSRLVSPATSDDLRDVSRLLQVDIPQRPAIALVPIVVNRFQCSRRLGRKNSGRMAVQVALVVFAPLVEARRFTGRALPGVFNFTLLDAPQIGLPAVSKLGFHL